MDSVQICFISLDAIYYGYILLYSSYKQKKTKKLQGDILLFSTGKNDADALLKQHRQQHARLHSTCAFTMSQ